jgi:hypothetical protein
MLVMGKYHIVTFGGPASRHTLIRFSNITKRRNAGVCDISFTKGHTLMVEKFAGCMSVLKVQFANYCWTKPIIIPDINTQCIFLFSYLLTNLGFKSFLLIPTRIFQEKERSNYAKS